jgi:hypothetical protein
MKPLPIIDFRWLILFCCCCFGCQDSPKLPYTIRGRSKHPLVLKRLIATEGAESSQSGRYPYYVAEFFHYVAIENMDDCSTCLPSVDDADHYRDTCTTGLPVGSVTFCTPFPYHPHDSRDNEVLNAHALLTVKYDRLTLADDRPEISSITYYFDGKPRTVNLRSPSVPKGERDSLLADLMRKVDAKYHTNYTQFQYGKDSVVVKFYKKKK